MITSPTNLPWILKYYLFVKTEEQNRVFILKTGKESFEF